MSDCGVLFGELVRQGTLGGLRRRRQFIELVALAQHLVTKLTLTAASTGIHTKKS